VPTQSSEWVSRPYPGRAMLKRETLPGTWHAPLSLLRMNADGVVLGSQFRWARLLVPRWSAQYGEITWAERVDVGAWKAVRIYKAGSRFGLLFAPRAELDAPDLLEVLRSQGVRIEPGVKQISAWGVG